MQGASLKSDKEIVTQERNDKKPDKERKQKGSAANEKVGWRSMVTNKRGVRPFIGRQNEFFEYTEKSANSFNYSLNLGER